MESADDRLRALAAGPEVKAFLAMPATAVYICRRDGHILWASPSMQAVFGYAPEELLHHNAWEIFPSKQDLEMGAKASALLNEGDLVVWLPLIDKEGRRAWYRMDCLNREGGCILAFRKELDPAAQRFHSFFRPGAGPQA